MLYHGLAAVSVMGKVQSKGRSRTQPITPKNKNGRRLPNRDLELSDMLPMIGSVIASKMRGSPSANPASAGVSLKWFTYTMVPKAVMVLNMKLSANPPKPHITLVRKGR